MPGVRTVGEGGLLYWALVIIGFLLGLLSLSTYILSFDQWQLYSKGNHLAAHGIWTHFGNISSGGLGNVPGTLSTILYGAPLKVWYSVYSPMALIAVLHLLAYLLLDHVIKDRFGLQGRMVFAVLYWLNPWRVMGTIIWNPTYLFLCSALHLWSAYRLRDEARFGPMVLHVLSIGMAFQLHNSSIMLAILSLALWASRAIRVHWMGAAVGIALVLLSLVPYVLTVIHAGGLPADGDEDAFLGRGLVYVFPLIKGVLYWFRYSSLYLSGNIMKYLGFDWILIDWLRLVVTYTWTALSWLLASVSLLGSMWLLARTAGAMRPVIRRLDYRRLDAKHWLLMYSLIAFATLFLISCLTPITYNHWHLLILFPFTLFPVLFFILENLERHRSRTKGAMMALAVYFIAVNVLACMESRRHSFDADAAAQFQAWLDAGELEPGARPPITDRHGGEAGS